MEYVYIRQAAAISYIQAWLICWLIQTTLIVVLLFTPFHIIPAWLISIYRIPVEKSTIVWVIAETVALFHLISLISQAFVDACHQSAAGSIIKLVFLSLSAVAFGFSALLCYLLVQSSFTWCVIAICTLGVVSFYFMYNKDEGNLMDVSLLLLSSLAVLYFSTYETELYSHSDEDMTVWQMHSEDCEGSRVIDLIWTCLINFSVSLRMWYSILNPLSVFYMGLRLLFVVFYMQWKSGRDQCTQESVEIERGSSRLPSSSTMYQVLLLVMLTHVVCQHLSAAEVITDADTDSPGWGLNLQIASFRFVQAILLQVFYIYSLYGTEDADSNIDW